MPAKRVRTAHGQGEGATAPSPSLSPAADLSPASVAHMLHPEPIPQRGEASTHSHPDDAPDELARILAAPLLPRSVASSHPTLTQRVEAAVSSLVPLGIIDPKLADPPPRQPLLLPAVAHAAAVRRQPLTADRLFRSAAIAHHYSPESAERYLECGRNPTIFARRLGGDEVTVRIAPNRCNSRWCPACNPTRRSIIAKRVELAVREMKWPSVITLTVRHDETERLAHQLDRVQRAWRNLLRSKAKERWAGGIRVLEVTHGQHGWHAHLHLLCDCQWFPKGELAELWAKASQGAHRVEVERLRCAGDAARYVAKYVSKEAGNAGESDIVVWERIAAMKGVRTISTFGNMAGFALASEPDQPDIDPDPLPGEVKLGSLSHVIALAERGDVFAQRVLYALCPDTWQQYRPPPPPVEQCKLW